MANVVLSDSDKLKVRNKALAKLEELELSDLSLVENYKTRFAICEIVYKVVLKEYLSLKGKSTKALQLNMNQIKVAMPFAGYDFDEDFLRRLFGSEKTVGNRTAKKLRDDLTHEISKSALNELTTRKDELFGLMDEFLEKIRTFDKAEN